MRIQEISFREIRASAETLFESLRHTTDVSSYVLDFPKAGIFSILVVAPKGNYLKMVPESFNYQYLNDWASSLDVAALARGVEADLAAEGLSIADISADFFGDIFSELGGGISKRIGRNSKPLPPSFIFRIYTLPKGRIEPSIFLKFVEDWFSQINDSTSRVGSNASWWHSNILHAKRQWLDSANGRLFTATALPLRKLGAQQREVLNGILGELRELSSSRERFNGETRLPFELPFILPRLSWSVPEGAGSSLFRDSYEGRLSQDELVADREIWSLRGRLVRTLESPLLYFSAKTELRQPYGVIRECAVPASRNLDAPFDALYELHFFCMEMEAQYPALAQNPFKKTEK